MTWSVRRRERCKNWWGLWWWVECFSDTTHEGFKRGAMYHPTERNGGLKHFEFWIGLVIRPKNSCYEEPTCPLICLVCTVGLISLEGHYIFPPWAAWCSKVQLFSTPCSYLCPIPFPHASVTLALPKPFLYPTLSTVPPIPLSSPETSPCPNHLLL